MGDRKVIIILSGEICTGKTTLADKLEADFGFQRCKTRAGLSYYADQRPPSEREDRSFQQPFGARLDVETDGKWVLDYFQHLYHKEFELHKHYLIDSVRIKEQVQHIRNAYSFFVYHIHL